MSEKYVKASRIEEEIAAAQKNQDDSKEKVNQEYYRGMVHGLKSIFASATEINGISRERLEFHLAEAYKTNEDAEDAALIQSSWGVINFLQVILSECSPIGEQKCEWRYEHGIEGINDPFWLCCDGMKDDTLSVKEWSFCPFCHLPIVVKE